MISLCLENFIYLSFRRRGKRDNKNCYCKGRYSVTICAGSDLSATAQIPVTLFTTGFPAGVYTYNGTNGEWSEITHEVNLYARFVVCRLMQLHQSVITKPSKPHSPRSMVVQRSSGNADPRRASAQRCQRLPNAYRKPRSGTPSRNSSRYRDYQPSL